MSDVQPPTDTTDEGPQPPDPTPPPAVEGVIVAGVVPDPARPDPAEPTLTDTMRAEVALHAAALGQPTYVEAVPDGCVAVQLAGRMIRLLPNGMWRSSAMQHLNAGNFNVWAQMCLAGNDYEDVWLEVDPTNDEVNDMFTRWRKIIGAPPVGKSPALRRS